MTYTKETILICRTGSLGDTLVSIPAIRAVRELYPNARIVLLTDHHPMQDYVSSWDVLQPLGVFSECLFVPVGVGCVRKFVSLIDLILKLRSFNLSRIFHFSPRIRTRRQLSRDWFFFRVVLRVGTIYGPKKYTALPKIDNKLPRLEPEWQRLLGIVPSVTSKKMYPKEILPISDEIRSVVLSKLQEEKIIDTSHLIAIAPGSKMPAKMWPEEYYEEFGNNLKSLSNQFHLVVFGGREDRQLGDKLVKSWGGRASNLAGTLSIMESGALLQMCLCYVGNDTGTMHLAAAVGTSCVAIFSARDYPGKWEPIGKNHIILRKEVGCEGCLLEDCVVENRKCLFLIEPNEVLRSLRALVDV